MDIFEKGETAFYHEMGAILKVKVTESSFDGEFADYHLLILEVLRKSPHRDVTFRVDEKIECTDCKSMDNAPMQAFRLSKT